MTTTNPIIMNYINDISVHKSDRGDTYTSYNVNVKNFGEEIWVVTVCDVSSGSYVMIKKISNNPFRGPGKEFESITDAIENYNSDSMKSTLREIYNVHSNNVEVE